MGSVQQGHGEISQGPVNYRYMLELAQDSSPAGRHKLAQAISVFFEGDGLNETENYLVVQIMMSLIHRAELDIREALAERLSVLANVPPEVVIFLANDEISVARPVLKNSSVLNDADLLYIIGRKGADYWQPIAEREKLSAAVAGRLVETGDVATVQSLVANPHVTLTKPVMKKLVRLSLTEEPMQPTLLRRPEMDTELAVDMYVAVTQSLRREIAQRFPLSSTLIEAAMDGLTTELVAEAQQKQKVTSELRTMARRYNERGDITPPLLIKTLRRGQFSFFIALFAEKILLHPETVLRLVSQEGGKNFAAAARAIGMMKSEFASIYLLSHGLRGESRTMSPRELAELLSYFDSIKDTDAQRMRKEWARSADEV